MMYRTGFETSGFGLDVLKEISQVGKRFLSRH